MAQDIITFVVLLLGMVAGYLLGCERVHRLRKSLAFYTEQNRQLHIFVDAVKQGRVRG